MCVYIYMYIYMSIWIEKENTYTSEVKQIKYMNKQLKREKN